MLPWNCNKGILAINDKMFVLDSHGSPHELKFYMHDGEIKLVTVKIENVPGQSEYITKSYQNELICLSSGTSNEIYSIQVQSNENTVENGYPIITYKLPAESSSNGYWSIVLPLNRGQFLVVQAILPSEYSTETISNSLVVVQKGKKSRFVTLPSEKSRGASPERRPQIWDIQIAEMITHGLVIRKGSWQSTWLTLFMTQNGIVYFVAVTPCHRMCVIHCASLTRLSLHGCAMIENRFAVFFGKFRHLIKLKF